MMPADQWGLFRFRDGDEGNCQLFSAEWLVAGGDEGNIFGGIIECEVENHPGVFFRHPKHFILDAQSPDNLIGLGVIAWKLDETFIAADILDHLKRNFGMYRIEPGAKWYREWMYRFPAVICHLNWCAGRMPPWYQRIAWAVSVAFKLDKTVHDSWILSFLLIQVAGDKGWIERWATRRFWKRFPWPSVADLMAEYFQSADHPIVLELKKNGR